MQRFKLSLTLILGLSAPQLFATFVPTDHELVGASLSGPRGAEGYVQLDKTALTISLALQPAMSRCPETGSCIDVMPAPVDYFFTKVAKDTTECGAVVYRAEHQVERIAVTVVDNTGYNYEQCPTYVPVPETEVQIQQSLLDDNGETQNESVFSGTTLSAVRY